jgi:hypothetical protein
LGWGARKVRIGGSGDSIIRLLISRAIQPTSSWVVTAVGESGM